MNKIKSILYGSPVIIVFIYLVIGILWILFSDQLVLSIFEDQINVTAVQTYKGLGFILLTSFLLYLLIQKNNNLLGEVITDLETVKNEFKSTFEQAAVGIVHHRPNEKWLRVNKKMCDMLGYERTELLELDFESFIHRDDIEKGRHLDQELLEGNRSIVRMEKRYRRRNGRYFTGLMTKSVAYNGNDSPMYLVAIIEDITERKQAIRKLHDALEHKELLLGEVHHRVKNNLALISALFEMQYDNTRDERVRKILDNSKIRIKTLAMIYENFSPADGKVQVEFGAYLDELIQYIGRVFNQKAIISHEKISNVDLNINQAVPVALICNEILVNAFLHAFNDLASIKPEIQIELSQSGDKIKLHISDNGSGIPKETEIENPRTIGFTIINTLISQIKGELTVSNENGTRFEILFRKSDVSGPGDSRKIKGL